MSCGRRRRLGLGCWWWRWCALEVAPVLAGERSRGRRGGVPPADDSFLRRRRQGRRWGRIGGGWALSAGPALGLGTVEGAGVLGGALLRGALVREARDTVLLGVEQHPPAGASDGALGWLRREVVVGVGEVLEPGELADPGGDGAR